MNNSLARHDWYQALLDDLTAIAVESVAASNLAYIEGKWLFGQRIAQENENFKREKIYGKKIVATVAESLRRSLLIWGAFGRMSIEAFLYPLAFLVFVGWFAFLIWWEDKMKK